MTSGPAATSDAPDRVDVVVFHSPADISRVRGLVADLIRTGLRVSALDFVAGKSEVVAVADLASIPPDWRAASAIVVLSRTSSGADANWLTSRTVPSLAKQGNGRLVGVRLDDTPVPEAIARGYPVVDLLQTEGPDYERSLQQLLALLRSVRAASNLPPPPNPVLRKKELRTLLAFFHRENPERRIASITGPAGSGKSALAVLVADRLRERYPDGQLFATFGERRDLRPVLRQFLLTLGVAPNDVPRDLAFV
jgi:hypothetical protein